MTLDVDRYRIILDALFDGAYCVDSKRHILYWNKAAEILTGFAAEDVIGHCCADNILQHVDEAGTSLCRHQCPLSHTMQDGHPRNATVFLHHRNGHRIPVNVRCMPLRAENDQIVGALELFSDATPAETMRQRIQELEDLAYVDHLSRLANRRFIEIDLDQRFQEYTRYGWPFGVFMADIDDFKRINDRYGHDVGDQVIRMISLTMSRSARPFDTIGRMGGDEFIGILRKVDGNSLSTIVDRMRLLIRNSFLESDNEPISVTMSIGATLVQESDTVTSLLSRVDRLLYRSKNQGRDCLNCG